ncbi:hypothetical protein V7S43_014526 [Phytophthora oleae]|uniref:phosphoribosylaminoimidazolesuccinocarboxamide synthase n=1 Tax=Phytophthora oleae TaxID=2107226 RepID=A0ABD3F0Q8_9STRA
MGVVVGKAEKHTPTCLSKLENDQTLTATSLALFKDRVQLVATDRQSDFDRALATVHHVLVQTSVWWFNQTKNIVANHLLGLTLSCYKSPLFLAEFTVPVYITGPTITSMFINNKNGSRDFFGHKLEDGYIQHQKLPRYLVGQGDEHDECILGVEVRSECMPQEQWDYFEKKAPALFTFGQGQAKRH